MKTPPWKSSKRQKYVLKNVTLSRPTVSGMLFVLACGSLLAAFFLFNSFKSEQIIVTGDISVDSRGKITPLDFNVTIVRMAPLSATSPPPTRNQPDEHLPLFFIVAFKIEGPHANIPLAGSAREAEQHHQTAGYCLRASPLSHPFSFFTRQPIPCPVIRQVPLNKARTSCRCARVGGGWRIAHEVPADARASDNDRTAAGLPANRSS